MRVTDKYTAYKPKNKVVSRHGTRMAFIEDLMKMVVNGSGDTKASFLIESYEKASVRASVAYLNERCGFNFFVTMRTSGDKVHCTLENRNGESEVIGFSID